MWQRAFTYSTGGGHVRQPRRRGRQRARDGRQVCGDGARAVREGRACLGRVVDRVRGACRSKARGLFSYDLATGEFGPAPEGVEGPQRPRRRHGARHVVRRRVPAGLVPEIGRADGLRRRVRPRRARHGAGEAGVLRARRPRRPPRRGLAAPTYARLPCPRARMASQEVSEHVEHVDDPHLTAHRTLPLVGERTGRYDQGRVAVRPVRSWSSGSASHTATR